MLIDLHVHCCRPRHPSMRRAGGSIYPSPERLIAMLDAAGISRAVVMAGVSPECRYTVVPTEEIVSICGERPDRLVPFANLDPRWLTNSASADFRPLLRGFREMGGRGIGEYVPNLPFDDPLNMNLFAQVEEMGLPLTFHIGSHIGGCYGLFDEPGLPRLERALMAFPKLTFIGHSQPFWAEIGANVISGGARIGYPEGKVTPGRLVELLRKYSNLHADLSARSGYNAITRDLDFGLAFLEEFQERLFFATDIANDPQELPIVPFFADLRAKGRISTEAWEKIAWRNAERVLGL